MPLLGGIGGHRRRVQGISGARRGPKGLRRGVQQGSRPHTIARPKICQWADGTFSRNRSANRAAARTARESDPEGPSVRRRRVQPRTFGQLGTNSHPSTKTPRRSDRRGGPAPHLPTTHLKISENHRRRAFLNPASPKAPPKPCAFSALRPRDPTTLRPYDPTTLRPYDPSAL